MNKDTPTTRSLRDLQWKMKDIFTYVDQPNEGAQFVVSQDGADGNPFKGDCDDYAMTSAFVAANYYHIPKEDIFFAFPKVTQLQRYKTNEGINFVQLDSAYHILVLVREGKDWYMIDNMQDRVVEFKKLEQLNTETRVFKYEWDFFRNYNWDYIPKEVFMRDYIDGKKENSVSPTMP